MQRCSGCSCLVVVSSQLACEPQERQHVPGEEVYLHIFARNLYHVGRQELVCVGADGSPLCSWNKKEKTHVGRQHK